MVNQVDAVKRLPVTSLVRQSTFKFVSPPFYISLHAQFRPRTSWFVIRVL